jgi:hypothetical protein
MHALGAGTHPSFINIADTYVELGLHFDDMVCMNLS